MDTVVDNILNYYQFIVNNMNYDTGSINKIFFKDLSSIVTNKSYICNEPTKAILLNSINCSDFRIVIHNILSNDKLNDISHNIIYEFEKIIGQKYCPEFFFDKLLKL